MSIFHGITSYFLVFDGIHIQNWWFRYLSQRLKAKLLRSWLCTLRITYFPYVLISQIKLTPFNFSNKLMLIYFTADVGVCANKLMQFVLIVLLRHEFQYTYVCTYVGLLWVIIAWKTFLSPCTQLFPLIFESSHLISTLFTYWRVQIPFLFSGYFIFLIGMNRLKLIVVVVRACVTKLHPLKCTMNRKNEWWSRWWLFIFELDTSDLYVA